MSPGFTAYVRLRPHAAEPDVKTDSLDPDVEALVALARLPLSEDLPDDDIAHVSG